MGANWARGDLHEYTLHAEADGNSIDLKFTGRVPAGMEYPGKLDIDWQTSAGKVHLVVSDPKLIEADDLLAGEPSWLRYLAKLFTHPYYLRFNASLDLSVDLGEVHAQEQGQTLFELMSFE